LKRAEARALVPPDSVVVGVDLAEAAHHVELVGGAVVLGVGAAVIGAGLGGVSGEGGGRGEEEGESRLKGELKRRSRRAPAAFFSFFSLARFDRV
jgi:hypothetical protein